MGLDERVGFEALAKILQSGIVAQEVCGCLRDLAWRNIITDIVREIGKSRAWQ